MRILLWSEGVWPSIGGVEVLLAQVALALRERNCEVIVVTPQDYKDLPIEALYRGVPAYRIPFSTALAGPKMEQLMEIRRRGARSSSRR
jgi:hypothetical protein